MFFNHNNNQSANVIPTHAQASETFSGAPCTTRRSDLAAAVVIAAFFSAGVACAGAQETQTVDVRGEIKATVDGVEREWVTMSGDLGGEDGSSAVWTTVDSSDVMNAMGLSEEQRQVMQQRMEQLQGAEQNPFADMFGAQGGGAEKVELRIAGFDPEAEKILREGILTLEIEPFPREDVGTMLAGRHEASISYFKNFGENEGLFVSTGDSGTAASVTFDALEIVDGGGRAEGEFEAGLCPVTSMMGSGGVDPDDCLTVAGHFSTELDEE